MQPHTLKLSRFFVRSVLMAFLGAFPLFALAQIGGLDPTFAPGAILNGAVPGEVRALSSRPTIRSSSQALLRRLAVSRAGILRS
jgi:hypothetical protein